MQKQIHIDTNKIIGTPDPRMWGIFFEEINHAGDGGLYAELINNRNFAASDIPEGMCYANGFAFTEKGRKESFPGDDPLPGWSLKKYEGSMATMEKTTEFPRNPECASQLKLLVHGKTRLINSGYWGIYAPAGDYHGTLIARSPEISAITVGLMRKDGSVLASTVLSLSPCFTKTEFTLRVTEGDDDARFFIEAEGNGLLWFDFVSLFPADTYQGEKYGLRKDLMEMLQELKPGFLRFPGGCVIEGITFENAIHWQKTIGPIEDRPGHWDLWGYRRTDGLGMLEFCKLGEALDADLMYVCNCSMTCQTRNSEADDGYASAEWIQTALDGIEYICGDVTTPWGAKRAADGHPAPFRLKYVEIGNEESGPIYHKRYAEFRAALEEKYPDLLLIATVDVPGEHYELRDDHYYLAPQHFLTLCDTYAGEGQKVYVGEYACTDQVDRGNLQSAVSEAAFMCGMENSCDRVRMASYAPLFCHENDQKWPINLIHFDRKHTFGLPSYYIQKLFATHTVETVVANDSAVVKGTLTNLYATTGISGNELVIKAANFGPESTKADFLCDAIPAGTCTVLTLSGESEKDTNSLLYPKNVAHVQATASTEAGRRSLEVAPSAFTRIRIPLR